MITTKQLETLGTHEKFQVNFIGHNLKAYKENSETIFVTAKGKRNKGYRFTANKEGVYISNYGIGNDINLLKIPTKENENIQWQKRLKRAVKLLNESGLWSNIKEVYENLLKYNITLEEKKKIYDLDEWNDHNPAVDYCKEKGYNFMINEKGRIKTDYIWEISRCELKSMYFGKYDNRYDKERIKKALEDKTELSLRSRANYDVSFEYNPEKKYAWYSEEYKDCGNGHYYLALDHNTALFSEND